MNVATRPSVQQMQLNTQQILHGVPIIRSNLENIYQDHDQDNDEEQKQVEDEDQDLDKDQVQDLDKMNLILNQDRYQD